MGNWRGGKGKDERDGKRERSYDRRAIVHLREKFAERDVFLCRCGWGLGDCFHGCFGRWRFRLGVDVHVDVYVEGAVEGLVRPWVRLGLGVWSLGG